ncbi:ninein isoform X6 [Antennarius striatus]|uniref:ninein isoform X6 n=1 Tax=Antennarius striatus TaxID=241820 RepID=UPI0035B1962B
MGDTQEQGCYEERLKDVFNSFDASGSGSLCPEELSDLCQSLQLEDTTPALLHMLLQNQDCLTARVDFEQFKNALILVLSSSSEQPEAGHETNTESPDIQPKFVKGSKRYGRRSTPEFTEPLQDLSDVGNINLVEETNLNENYDSAVPRKRERWNSHDTSTEEYEAEGQMHLWNPDEPSTPRRSNNPLSSLSEETLREACDELAISWDGRAAHSELLALCEHLCLELNVDGLQSLSGDGVMSVQEFVCRVANQNKPPTPSSSTPYRQLKRHHSTQPFDEGGRRIATPSVLTSTIGMRLFSTLDDGTGFTPVSHILDAWLEEGIENSSEILQALNFSLDGKLNLYDLTSALENELLVTKNGIHQAALASFKAEITYLLERVDREVQEKEKIRSDLEKAERLKSQLATEVDEHHSAIELTNNLNLKKLEQDHKEKLTAVRLELMKEMEQLRQQAGLQREQLEAEVQKIREDESFLRDHLSISVKENRRLEMELLDSNEKFLEAQSQIAKLQTSVDKIIKEKFGDLDPGSADIFLQEEQIKQLHISYEAQCRELQDRIDELQSELQEVQSLGRIHQPCHKPLSEELESKSPGMESDPGIGSEDVQPFSMSLEAEMMMEQLKEQHLLEMEDLQNQLQSKINEFDKMVEEKNASHEDQKASLALQYQQEIQTLREEMASIQNRAQRLQVKLEQAELEQTQAKQREEQENLQEEEVGALRQELLQAHTYAADLDGQLKAVEALQTDRDQALLSEMEELRTQHAIEIKKLEKEHINLCDARLGEERKILQEEKAEIEIRLLHDFEREKERLQQGHEVELKARLEETNVRFEEERSEIVQRLTEQWQKERAQLDEQHNETLQLLLEEEMLRLIREQEERESKLREQWEQERAQILECQEEVLLNRILQERIQLQEQFEQREKKLKEEWETEKLQLEEDYEGMLQERLSEERAKFACEMQEEEERQKILIAEEMACLEASHREVVKEMTVKHTEEREALSNMLDKLRDDFAQERKEIEISFSQRIKEVEDRFLGDQESVAKHVQDNILKLEQHYQSEIEALSESHVKQKRHWEAETEEAVENARQQRQMIAETMEQEQKSLDQQWRKEHHELERLHQEKTEELIRKNKQLQNELDDFMIAAQNKEIELSRQLNDLHNRLQESLEKGDKLHIQSEKKALETELLLSQIVEDFKEERAELLSSQAELEAKIKMLSTYERHSIERTELLTERNAMKMKLEEMEIQLKQVADEFELERKELKEHLSILELKNGQENDREELLAERDILKMRIKELQMELSQGWSFSEKAEEEEESNEINTLMEMGVGSCCVPLGNGLNSSANYSNKEHVCFAVLNSCSENIKTLDHDTNDDPEEGTLEVKRECEHNGQIFEMVNKEKWAERDTKASCMSADVGHESCGGCNPDFPDPEEKNSNIDTSVSQETKFEAAVSSLQASEGEDASKDENGVALGSCEKRNMPQVVPALDVGKPSHENGPHHETVVDSSVLEEIDDPDTLTWMDAEVTCLPDDFHDCDALTAKIEDDCLQTDEESESDLEDRKCSFLKLQASYGTATEENILLHEKISLLQQKTEILENLLAHNSEKVKYVHQVQEESYSLKVKILLLMEHVKKLEIKTLMTRHLQIRYEDCMCENTRLRDQNSGLEKRVWSLEDMIFHDFQDHFKVSLMEEFGRREENSKMFSELKGDGLLSGRSESPTEDILLDFTCQPDVQVEAPTDVGRCGEFEKENTSILRAINELQDKSQTLNETTQAHRTKASRLAEEKLVVGQKLTALKEEELKQTREELTQTLELLKEGRIAAQNAQGNLKKQISDLCLQKQQLEDENRMLSEKDAENVGEVENLRLQLVDLIKENKGREVFPTEERTELEACVSALKIELTRALEGAAKLEEKNTQLSQQLSGLRERAVKVDHMESQITHLVDERKSLDKETHGLRSQLDKAEDRVRTLDDTLQTANHQSARLMADFRVLQKERDSLKHDILLLHKRLQIVTDKNRVLEKALHSSSLHNQSKKRYRNETSQLMDQDQQLLRQENEKLHAEMHNIKEDLVQSKEKVRQLDATILSLTMHKQSSLVAALEQENVSLKQELEEQKELTKGHEAGQGQAELESLQQENEALKDQMARLSAQLLDTFQAHFVGLLPPSPHRMPRGQHQGEDQENVQDDRERKMKNMEERMKEIELSLRNVKLLLKEKVAQLKEQVHKNGKADVLINDLYVENTQLLKALEITEQRHKITEKKNYLLEEKISSLNKIVRELHPTALETLPYHFKCSS